MALRDDLVLAPQAGDSGAVLELIGLLEQLPPSAGEQLTALHWPAVLARDAVLAQRTLRRIGRSLEDRTAWLELHNAVTDLTVEACALLRGRLAERYGQQAGAVAARLSTSWGG